MKRTILVQIFRLTLNSLKIWRWKLKVLHRKKYKNTQNWGQENQTTSDKMDLKSLLGICFFIMGAMFSCLDIGSDISLACEHYHKAGNATTILKTHHAFFFVLTTVWIAFGGVGQMIIFLRYLCIKHSCVDQIPSLVKVLILISAPLLMAPVVVNVFCAYLIARGESHMDEKTPK